MQTITTLEVRESILNNNDELAKGNRERLRGDNIFLVNISSELAGLRTERNHFLEDLILFQQKCFPRVVKHTP